MRRPLGCFTFSALVAAVLVLLAVLAAAVATGNGIFSPGQLSAVTRGSVIGGVTSHADLAARCDACHAVVGSTASMGDLCLTCHTQVRQDIASSGGLHGRMLATTGNCRDCHADHRGATASLTLANPTIFPHEQTGYSLGSHQLRGNGGAFVCQDCHTASLATFSAPTCASCHQARDAVFMTSHQQTFGTLCLACHDGVDSYGKSFAHTGYALTGAHAGGSCASCHQGQTTMAALRATTTSCVGCHAAKDIHQGRLGTSCVDCHTPATWTGATINHDRTRLPLVGLHVGVLCESCHVDRHWTGIGLTCRSCHAAADPHAGQFPGDCGACHAATGWKDVTFDHSTTTFALAGAHAGTACAACHANNVYAGTPTTCAACHAKPATHGTAMGGACSSCHTTKAWLPASFDHTKAAFPLTGAHLSVTCLKCHVGNVYAGTPTTCAACHAKPATHGTAMGGACSSCHTTKAWLPASFDHTKAAFPLTGAHLSVTCLKCHVGNVYAGTPTTCAACHAKPATHGTAMGGACSSCHTTKAWLPASFDHTKAAFPLTGAHLSVTCLKCHVGNVYAGTPTTCAACHAKPATHGTAMGGACSSCHTTKAWLPASFDHTKAAFPLTGAHLSVTCLKCHVGNVYAGTPTTCAACHAKPATHGTAMGGACSSCHTTKAWLPASFDHTKAAFPLTGAHLSVTCLKCHVGNVYAGTPTTCAACHAKPATHGSSVGNICSTCHTTTAWLPATFSGTHTFPMTHHGSGGVCAKCHPSTWATYSCASCHSDASMTSHHQGVSGFSLTTCAKCHPTGSGGG